MSRFAPGQSGELNGIRWRVMPGRKAPGDLRLDICTREFRAVPMPLGFLFADFFYENENLLFPKEAGYQGGERYLNYCRGAALLGWEAAFERLAEERAARRAA